MNRILFYAAVSCFFGAGLSGCSEEASPGISPEQYWAEREANSFKPPVRADLTVYTDNIDSDVGEEFIAYWEIFDASGRETACDCDFELRLLNEAGNEIWERSWWTKEGDYKWKTIGRGSLEREIFVFTWTWSFSESDYEFLCGDYHDFRLDLETKDGSLLQDKDRTYVPC